MTDQLNFPRPANRDLVIHTVLHVLQQDTEAFAQYMRDPDSVLSRFDLDEEGHRLLRDHDYKGMVARGVHPILVVQLQRRIEWGVSRFTDEASQPH